MKIKCLIVDDEPLAIEVIANYLQNFEDFEIVAKCENPLNAFQILEKQTIHLIFLDIQMPLLNGLDFIRNLENPPLIIITTAYRDYAIESFDLDVVDYLMKPINFPRFIKAIHKVNKLIKLKNSPQNEALGITEPHLSSNPHEESFIFLKVDKKMVKVLLKDILYIESLKDYIRVKTKIEELIVHQTLSGITELLPAEMFVRIHRSFTIAIDKVKAVEGNCVEIAGKLLPIGRNYLPEAKEKIYKNS